MKHALAESIKEKLEEDNDVLETELDTDGDVSIVARVPNHHAKQRVKRTLHQYPFYVELEVANAGAD